MGEVHRTTYGAVAGRRGPFNVMLRVYGPTGNTAPGAGYNPPAITIAR